MRVFKVFDPTVTRRDFCGRVAGNAAALSLGAMCAAEEDKPAFKLNYMLASSMYGRLPLAQVLGEVRQTGTDVIDIWPERHANHREQIEEMGHERFMALLAEHRVKLGMITQYKLGPFRLKEELPVIRKFGGSLTVCMGGIRETKQFIEKMKPTLAIAAEHKVRISIENHGESPDELRAFAEATADEPMLGVALAPLHLKQDEKMIAKLIEDLGPKLYHFYAWQYGKGHSQKDAALAMQQMPGVGPLDFVPLVAALKKIEFRGWTEVFMHPTPRGIPILPTAAQCTEAINKSRAYLDACVEKLA